MAYRDDLEAALLRAEALERDRTAHEPASQASGETVALREQLSMMRMQLASLRSERSRLERSLTGVRAELDDERHAREVLQAQKRVLALRNEQLTLQLEAEALERAREQEARRWAVRGARDAADALRELRLRSVGPEKRRPTGETRRRILSWVSAAQLSSESGPEHGKALWFARFSPAVLRRLVPERRAGRLRELACRVAQDVWAEHGGPIQFEPALLLLRAAGHVLAPRHGATLRFDIRSDGLSLEWLDEAEPIVIHLSAADGIAVLGVREWQRTPVH